jgi:4-hydroxy-4-methyl-2-oxoglutarate aldolase
MSTPKFDLTPELVEELLVLGTATIYEASKSDCYLPSTLRPVWKGAGAVGWALPVSLAAADNLPMHLALEVAQEQDLIVADGQGEACGYWGEILAVGAQERGVTGLVLDGGVRDTARLEELQFPVFSSSVAIRGTVKRDRGSIGQPIQLGRVTVSRGDLVVADADGVLALAPDRVPEVLEASRERLRAETEYLERIRGGELTLDIYGLRNNGLPATATQGGAAK